MRSCPTVTHENLKEVPFEGEGAGSPLPRHLQRKARGLRPQAAIFNFPFNASTPELERWLPGQVRAFRTGGKAQNPLPHKGQAKLTCASFGPGNCEAAVDREVEALLAAESGWMIFNTHGPDEEGWGPIRATRRSNVGSGYPSRTRHVVREGVVARQRRIEAQARTHPFTAGQGQEDPAHASRRSRTAT